MVSNSGTSDTGSIYDNVGQAQLYGNKNSGTSRRYAMEVWGAVLFGQAGHTGMGK